MKKQLLLLMMFLPMVAWADAVEIDGLWYELVSRAKEAKVIQYKNNVKYSGNIVIPETVTDNDVEYSVTSIGSSAFYNCSSLASVTIPNSVTSIEYRAFYGCSGLTSVTIPNSVTSIGQRAFEGCTGLTSVTIGNSVTSIGSDAFYGCSGLTSITIPNSVTSIGDYAFAGCSGLTSVHISDIKAWCKIAFSGWSSNPLSYAHHLYLGGEEITILIIPNSVTSIGDDAFGGCSGLTSVTIPNSVTSIGSSAFARCSSLTSVTIPNSVTSIGSSAFYNCSSLTSVTIPNRVTSIGDYAFENCSSLTSVTIGSGVKDIGSQAFAKCTELADVYCLAENVPTTKSDAFQDSYIEYSTLHVPAESVSAYKEKEPWSGFKEIVALDGETPEEKKCATPTIALVDGKIKFACETEGAEFVSEVTFVDNKKNYTDEVSITGNYKVSVYATKTGYDNSDVATAEFSLSGGGTKGDVNGDGVVDIADAVKIVNIVVGKE